MLSLKYIIKIFVTERKDIFENFLRQYCSKLWQESIGTCFKSLSGLVAEIWAKNCICSSFFGFSGKSRKEFQEFFGPQSSLELA